jgi:hypothetical protein
MEKCKSSLKPIIKMGSCNFSSGFLSFSNQIMNWLVTKNQGLLTSALHSFKLYFCFYTARKQHLHYKAYVERGQQWNMS